ncbi:hypothetical protein ACUY3K_09955 [Corynebacterium uberis]|uniref:hypothetical protein n=1 Tax=Corynebacterium TaxID=1716 RepID=UPI001D09EF32|nr:MULTISPECIES: hypothetical protein [Corynebacterium]MCZ9308199.1 hypothetical protein [Corynebacterium sp. c6VSa_13]UDL73880.1 hypothetical protein LH391_01220 [Corynebacterium uberis]UDL75237.1 hypothetical protein LH393_08195 [Corynebacterium uberis]UDL77448.1 hypothetical protein LH394_08175 [Corynebacterium uberis]UDL79734.1 hypothetical protein LH392_08605 [Corynebacterium uberis]
MHRIAAELRHRELTQELYDIGDEVATYLDNLEEAIADYDAELVEDCLTELADIIDDARVDARVALGELLGLRQALTTGVRAGVLSARTHTTAPLPRPRPLDCAELEAAYPLEDSPIIVAELAGALEGRTQAVRERLTAYAAWILQQTDACATDLESVALPHQVRALGEDAATTARAWLVSVAQAHPAYARAMRGSRPPAFLGERAWIDGVIARIKARRSADSGAAS